MDRLSRARPDDVRAVERLPTGIDPEHTLTQIEAVLERWRREGRKWNMGLSKYPSGRIHIDRNGFRTWGASHKRGSSYCLDTADR